MRERLFHLFAAGAFAAFQDGGAERWEPPSLAREGFVHLSFARQIPGTLAAHFTAESELVLVEVELEPEPEPEQAAERGGRGLVVEPSRGGELFPHLYRALRRGELRRAWPLARDARGAWRLPRLAGTAEADRPRGERLA